MFNNPRRGRPVIRMLNNPDPNVRLRAVNILGGRKRPRAAWLLRRVVHNDPNPQVREQAKFYMQQWGRAMLDQFNETSQAAAANHPGQKLWECEFCGTKDVKGGACPNCGAPRPDEDDD